MNSLCTGSTWLITTASTLSPLIALFIGFAGTDWLLRWQVAETRDPHSGEGGAKLVGGIGDEHAAHQRGRCYPCRRKGIG
jgi:hypothetical protein